MMVSIDDGEHLRINENKYFQGKKSEIEVCVLQLILCKMRMTHDWLMGVTGS